MRIILFVTAIIAFASACSSSRKLAAPDPELEKIVSWMVGDFSSQAQSKRDSDFFDIRLHIRPIWIKDKGNHWLYVEQATAAAESKPYRQRVYKVERDSVMGWFRSVVYTLPDQEKWAGAYKTPEKFDALKPSDLSLRDGCAVYLRIQQDGSYAGATRGKGCESTLKGAKYASSKVTLNPRMLRSWDQGFNEKGEQVWGATKGGYEFARQ